MRYPVLLILLAHVIIVDGQEAKSHESFYSKQQTAINDWLLSNGVPDSLLKANIIEQGPTGLVVKMKLKDRFNWDGLNGKVEQATNIPFPELLFDKTSFLFDQQRDSLQIHIDGKDLLIIIKPLQEKVAVSIFEKMGEISDNHEIPIGEIKGFVKLHQGEAVEDLSVVKSKVEKKLEVFFRKYESRFQNYKFNVITRLGKELVMEIDNVVDVVLDENYFEHLRIAFKFETAGDKLKVGYTIRGKYGAGIIWSPKNADYYDMDPKYLDELNSFSLKIKNEVHQIIVTP